MSSCVVSLSSSAHLQPPQQATSPDAAVSTFGLGHLPVTPAASGGLPKDWVTPFRVEMAATRSHSEKTKDDSRAVSDGDGVLKAGKVGKPAGLSYVEGRLEQMAGAYWGGGVGAHYQRLEEGYM